MSACKDSLRSPIFFFKMVLNMLSDEILSLLQSFLTVAFLAPILILSSSLIPSMQPLSIGLWSAALALDAYTTLRFYKLNPAEFTRLERNVILVSFIERLGFKRGLAFFILFFEVPVTLLLGAVFLPIIHAYLTSIPDLAVCISASFGLVGVEHAQAAWRNNSIYKKIYRSGKP